MRKRLRKKAAKKAVRRRIELYRELALAEVTVAQFREYTSWVFRERVRAEVVGAPDAAT